jgi:hypothetical protein
VLIPQLAVLVILGAFNMVVESEAVVLAAHLGSYWNQRDLAELGENCLQFLVGLLYTHELL